MVRAALSQPKRFGQGPSPYALFVPAVTVVAASLLAALPIVSTSGWFPDFGYLALISWRLLRADPWPAWWAAPLGLVNDLFTGYPIGFSMALWSATMLALDLVDRRTMWRDYWIEWVVATLLIALNEWLHWEVARMTGADIPFTMMVPQLLISICVFPLSAWMVSRFDRWRLGPMKPVRITSTHQSITFSRRMLLLGGAQIGIGGLLVGRLGWLAIAQNERYQLLSESNRVQLIPVPPRRGWIIDRYGKPIAINRASFRVDIIPQQLEKGRDVVPEVARLLQLDEEEVARIRAELAQSQGFHPVQVGENVTYDQYAAVTVRLPDLPGVQATQGYSRYYPDGPAVAHLVGYVGSANAKEYEAEDKNPLLLIPGFKIGKQGLEKTLEPYLRGTPGGQRVEVTARGKLVKELDPKPDRSGQTVQLTIDEGLQQYAARRMGDQSGALVAMDVMTGDMLAYVSMPAFDPNSFSEGIGQTEWKMLSENDHIPLLNKVAQGLYPSGSTIKPAMALGFLKQGLDPNRKFHCSGGVQIGNRYFRDDAAHGTVDMRSAIARSCNAYFWSMGLQTDPQETTEMVNYLGYGEEFDLPIPSQRFGTMPNPKWLEKKYHREWQGYDTANTSIGQGYVLINPMQLAVMPARIASGKLIQPRLLMGAPRKPIPDLSVDPEHLKIIREGMTAVVNGAGTAVASKLPLEGVQMAGKTGTAQVYKLISRGHQSNWNLRDHALFIAFAPADKPRYAIGCIIEHGGFGASAAAPIVRDTMTYFFDKQKAFAALAPLEEQWGGTLAERNARQLAEFKAASRATQA